MNGISGVATITASSHGSPNPASGFRSERQWFPWWQVDLAKPMRLEGFSLKGLQGEDRQPPLLTIMISDDGEHWLPLWTQALHEPEDSHNFQVRFDRVFATRYIRIRADAYGCLAFNTVVFSTQELQGHERSVSDDITIFERQADDSRVVFSTLFNESDAFLSRYIDNFLAYTSENICLALNFPNDRRIPDDARGRSPRIHIFNGQTKREKWGHTLLVGHIESYEEARSVFPDFRYFATMASNSLLVRPFDVAAAIMQLPLASPVPVACERAYELDQEVDPVNPTYHGTWMWHHLRNSEGLGQYLRNSLELDRVSVTQIEGLFARREEWEHIQERRNLITGLERYISFENFMALEELLPTSIFNKFGSGEYTHICRVLWSGTRQTTVDDLITMVPHLPAHLCAMKWFDRAPIAQSTMAVTTDWGRALVSRTHQQHATLASFQETTLITTLLKSITKSERFGPITDKWWDSETQGRRGFHWSMRDIACERQQIYPDIPGLRDMRVPPAILFMEATGQLVSLSMSLYENSEGDTTLRLSCSAVSKDGGPVSGVHLQGYLYLSGMQGSSVFRMTIRKDRCVPHDVFSRTVFYDEFGYTVDYADRLERDHETERHYFVREARGNDLQVWIGLPVFCNATAEVSLAVGPDFKTCRQKQSHEAE
ncbi:discoidin domain-containing protein [Asaia bogorensis]|uniref:discoidin domain-containing protein n=1 Tax=Asaia bogorensis TaxID=91915 RepID=UPI000EFA6C82|nr:discoidin domain-containing protein [Asaia bogorensis]